MTQLIAILMADLHLSHKAPAARSCEKDWYAVQRGYLRQVSRLQKRHSRDLTYQIPVVVAGDLFDRWNAPAELVNFALANLPKSIFAVPGNHDLPPGGWKDLKKTAFYTLVKANRITLLEPGKPMEMGGRAPLRMHGFPSGFQVKPLENLHDMLVEIAVVHQYIWTKATGHPGADPEHRAKAMMPRLKGYDVACFGDNHTPLSVAGPTRIFNPGTFMCRKSDERGITPSVGLLRSDNSIERFYLDVSGDRFVDAADLQKTMIDYGEFMAELSQLGDVAISFADAILRRLDRDDVPEAVKGDG